MVLVICFVFTTVIDMVAGVTAGIITACFLLIRRIASITQIQVSYKKKCHPKISSNIIPHDTIVYHINGTLFFGNAEEILEQIETVSPHFNTFIIDLEDVPFIDATSLVAIKRIVMDLSKNGKRAIICTHKSLIKRLRQKIGINGALYEENTKDAIRLAKDLSAAPSN